MEDEEKVIMEEQVTEAEEQKPSAKPKKPAKKTEKQAAEKPPAKKTHVVEAGDTLRSISLRYYGTASKMGAIRKENQLATDFLRIGRELKLP